MCLFDINIANDIISKQCHKFIDYGLWDNIYCIKYYIYLFINKNTEFYQYIHNKEKDVNDLNRVFLFPIKLITRIPHFLKYRIDYVLEEFNYKYSFVNLEHKIILYGINSHSFNIHDVLRVKILRKHGYDVRLTDNFLIELYVRQECDDKLLEYLNSIFTI